MTNMDWIGASLAAARPKAVAALLRHFRDLDTAEEAFQEASLRALKAWPENGPPRDPAAWLIMVGRNIAIDGLRKRSKHVELPSEDQLSDLGDAEEQIAETIDDSHYRDDILRLLFICCHPGLPAAQQIALALRVISGLSVKEIARAFLVTEAAMEQRITRAKRKVASVKVPFAAPGAVERSERLAAVAAMIYLLFNEGYAASGGDAHVRRPLCDEALRLSRLLLKLYAAEPEVMGLTALLLLQNARAPARLDADGAIVVLEKQDRRLWDQAMIAEGLALLEKAIRHRRPGAYQVQAAIAALHDSARRPEDTDWSGIEALYGSLERLQPSPVVTLNRAVAVSKSTGAEAALAMIAPLEGPLAGYFYFHGAKGAFLKQLGRAKDAHESFNRAIALAHSPAEADHIRQQLDSLADFGSRQTAGAAGKI
ncbi:MAG: RNA polymerase sigma factor [Hyphomicrobium sp.]